MMRVRVLQGVLGAVLLWSPLAEAVDKKECAQNHADAQKSMRNATLRKARDHLKVCSRDECLALVRKDCVAWLDEVNAGIPSIVVEAKGPDGKETFDVKLSINNEVVSNKLDVKAIELDPGTFTIKFEREGSAPIEKEVVLRQGQKNKLVDVSFVDPKATAAVPIGGAKSSDQLPLYSLPREKSVLPWVIGGVGVALAGGGAFFWLKSESERSDLQSSCAPKCDPSAADDITTQRLIGDILVGAGVVAIGVAVVWLVTDFSASSSRSGSKSGVQWTGSSRPHLLPNGFAF